MKTFYEKFRLRWGDKATVRSLYTDSHYSLIIYIPAEQYTNMRDWAWENITHCPYIIEIEQRNK